MALTAKSAHAKDLRTTHADMQHRHFATIAAILRGYRSNMERDIVKREAEYETLVQHFANELRHTNLNFDRARFIAACMAV